MTRVLADHYPTVPVMSDLDVAWSRWRAGWANDDDVRRAIAAANPASGELLRRLNPDRPGISRWQRDIDEAAGRNRQARLALSAEMAASDGPDCGVDGCAREVGHIGEHRRDPAEPLPTWPRHDPALGVGLVMIAGAVAVALVVAWRWRR